MNSDVCVIHCVQGRIIGGNDSLSKVVLHYSDNFAFNGADWVSWIRFRKLEVNESFEYTFESYERHYVDTKVNVAHLTMSNIGVFNAYAYYRTDK